jgi:hypothetical protein
MLKIKTVISQETNGYLSLSVIDCGYSHVLCFFMYKNTVSKSFVVVMKTLLFTGAKICRNKII